MPVLRASLLLLALVATSCARSGPYAEASRQDTADAYRAFLRAHPDDDAAGAARERLARLEFERASKIHSVVAYKRFLEEFPEMEKAPAARALLEGLRFNAAQAQGTAPPLRQFLRDHPEGKNADAARGLLAKLELAELSSLSEPEAVRSAVRSAPSEAQRETAEARLDEVTYQRALASGASALFGYLRDFPAGAHRLEAQRVLAGRAVDGLIASGLLEQAKAALARSPFAAGLQPQRDRLREAEALERAVAKDSVLQRARVGHYLRGVEDLRASLAAPDPLDRWQAAEELGQHVSVAALEPLLTAFRTARNPLIRDAAFRSLRSVLRALPREVADHELAVRIEALRERAAGPELHAELAVLLDLSGQVAAAAAEYRRAFDATTPDPVVLRRWTEIRAERGEAYSAAVAARQISLWARAQVEEPAAPGALAAARQRCAAFQLAREAREVVRTAGQTKTEFPEDLVDFDREADRALKLTAAALTDAELALKASDPTARLCADTRVAERLREGEKLRLEALAQLQRAKHPLAAKLAKAAADVDPSEAVRGQARQWVAGDVVR